MTATEVPIVVGLSSVEAAHRLATEGPNELPTARPGGLANACRAASTPATLPNTSSSVNEFEPSRFAP